MKFILKWALFCLLGFGLVACSNTTTTLDPVVGKADYQALENWAKSVEGTLDLEQAISEIPRTANASEARSFLEKRVAEQFDAARASANALNLQHRDVIQMRDYYLQSFDLMQQAVNFEVQHLTGTSIEELRPQVLPVIEQLEKLDQQGNALLEKLDEQFAE